MFTNSTLHTGKKRQQSYSDHGAIDEKSMTVVEEMNLRNQHEPKNKERKKRSGTHHESSIQQLRRNADQHLKRFFKLTGNKLDLTKHELSPSYSATDSNPSFNTPRMAYSFSHSGRRDGSMDGINPDTGRAEWNNMHPYQPPMRPTSNHLRPIHHAAVWCQNKSNELPSFGVGSNDTSLSQRSLNIQSNGLSHHNASNQIIPHHHGRLSCPAERASESRELSVAGYDKGNLRNREGENREEGDPVYSNLVIASTDLKRPTDLKTSTDSCLLKASEILSRRIGELKRKTFNSSMSPRCRMEPNFVPPYSVAPILGQPLIAGQSRNQYSHRERTSDNCQRETEKNDPPAKRQISDDGSGTLWELLTQQLHGSPSKYRLLYNPNSGEFEGILAADALQKLIEFDAQNVQELTLSEFNKNQSSDMYSSPAPPKSSPVCGTPLNSSPSETMRSLPALQSGSQLSSQETVAVAGIRGIAVNRGTSSLYDNSLHTAWREAVHQCEPEIDRMPSDSFVSGSTQGALRSSASNSGILNAPSSISIFAQKPENGKPPDRRFSSASSDNSKWNSGRLHNGSNSTREDLHRSDPPYPHPQGVESRQSLGTSKEREGKIPQQTLPIFAVGECTAKKEKRSKHRSRHIKGLRPSMLDGFPNSQAAGDILWHATGACDVPWSNSAFSGGAESESTTIRQWEPSFGGYGSVDPVIQLRLPGGRTDRSQPMNVMWNYPDPPPYSAFQCQPHYSPYHNAWASPQWDQQYYPDLDAARRYYSHERPYPRTDRRHRADKVPCLCVD